MAAALPHKIRMPGEDRRRQLLKAAIESFSRHGFGGTKTKDIAAAAGVSEAILFRHFASKEDLYHAILDFKEKPETKDQFLGVLEQFAAQRDDAKFFQTLATAIVHSFRDDPAFHRLMLYASLEGHLLASLFRARFGLPIGNFLRSYVALRQKEGVFQKCDPETAVTFLCGPFVQYAMTRHLFGINDHPMEEEAVIEQLVGLVMRGLKK